MTQPHDRLFAVIRSRGPVWDSTRSMDEQRVWQDHAAFMNALAAEGFVLLGGPLEGTGDVLLIVRARSADAVRSRLAADPWNKNGLLLTKQVVPWRLRLGSLD